jgi:hypothetical protein
MPRIAWTIAEAVGVLLVLICIALIEWRLLIGLAGVAILALAYLTEPRRDAVPRDR